LSWGGAIIALTFVTRAVLIPLTYRQLKSMRALQALQPQLKEIQEKFKSDPQRKQQEMLRFYQQNKINPLGACVPLLAQLPVFITLFYVLRHELPADMGCQAGHCGAHGGQFWFISDLTAKATGTELIVLLVLYVGTMLGSSLVMMVTTDTQQRAMMFILPVVFIPFVIRFPAGLVLYWITTNVWTIGQQYVIQRIVPAPPVPTVEQAKAERPPPPPPRKRKKRR